MKPVREIGNWQFVFTRGDVFEWNFPFMRQLTVGIFRINSLPEEGIRINKGNYTGFMWSWYYFTPVRKTRP